MSVEIPGRLEADAAPVEKKTSDGWYDFHFVAVVKFNDQEIWRGTEVHYHDRRAREEAEDRIVTVLKMVFAASWLTTDADGNVVEQQP